MVASQKPPAGDLAHKPGMCPDWELNWQPFGSQAGTQSTEPHQPGLQKSFYWYSLSSSVWAVLFLLHFVRIFKVCDLIGEIGTLIPFI